MTKYFARKGSRIKQADAEIIGPALEKIKQRHKTLTAELILAEARRRRSPLNQFFEWDDTKAANQYRLVQARTMRGAIEVVINETKIPAFHRVTVLVQSEDQKKPKPVSVFLGIEDILESEAMVDQWINQAKLDLVAYRNRYEARLRVCKRFQEAFGEVFEVIAAVEERVQKGTPPPA